MSGTKAGGLKAAKTNKELHGEDFYKRIGKKGGFNGHTGGFFANPELARLAGAKGGRSSKRGGSDYITETIQRNQNKIKEMLAQGYSVKDVANEINVSDATLRRRLKENKNV